jgi:hypothetical protein
LGGGLEKMTKLTEKIETLLFAILLIFLTGGNRSQQVFASEVNLDILCRDFPENSRCKNDKVTSEEESREDKIPQQKDSESKATEENSSAKVIKLNVSATGGGEEWVKIEKNGDRVKLLHTAPSLSGVSELLNIAAPLPVFNFHKWNDHKTTRIVFKPDNCSSSLSSDASQPNVISQTATTSSSCEITGENSIELPEGTDITQGRFTMDYSDGEASVERSISFKIPAEEIKKASK